MGNCIGSIMSNVIYFSEKFAMFLSFSMLITCSIVCLICMLAFGVGLGYNYSFVDFKTRHTYVAGSYKKVRPTSYFGPGHYKPTTMDPKYTKPKRKKTAQRWWYNNRRAHKTTPETEVFDVINELPENLPVLSPVAMVPKEVPPTSVFDVSFNRGPKLEGLYFSTPKDRLRIPSLVLPQNDSTTVIKTDVSISNDTEVDKLDIKEDVGNAPNTTRSDVNVFNATKNVKALESIPVNVTKTSDSAAPLVLKTMMHQDQLMKWLTRLQDANKTFAVHVITN